MITIWHNSKCSKSRECLKLLQESKKEFTIRDYIQNPPSMSELRDLLRKLKLEPQDIIRKKEDLYSELNIEKKLANKQDLTKLLCQHSRLIERPIVILGDHAVIARPVEKIWEVVK